MALDLVALTSPDTPGARFAMVERAQLIEPAEMLQQVCGLTIDVKQMADRRAAAVIDALFPGDGPEIQPRIRLAESVAEVAATPISGKRVQSPAGAEG